MRIFCLCLLLVGIVAVKSNAQQNVLDFAVTISEHELPLPFNSFVERLERQHRVKFFFHPGWTSYLKVNRAYSNMPLGSVLDQLLADTEISYSTFEDYGIVLLKDPAHALVLEQLLSKAIAERKKIQQVKIGNPENYDRSKRITLRGTIIDEKTSLAVNNATITVLDESAGATSNELGYYELVMTPGEHILSYRHANYTEKVIELQVYSSGQLNIELEELAIMLDEVIVSDQAIMNTSIGQMNLKMPDLKRAPTFLGEVDLIKHVQIQPGVTTVGEVAAGYNVRGGGVDQNLILFDGIQIFNPAHALGFFSAVNTDVITQASFYKSGIPAEFGGRVSSVMNVGFRDGDYYNWKGSGGIGIISSHATVHGPIKRDTTSFLASFRTTYSNWMLNLVNSEYNSLVNSSVYFYDGTVKLAHKFSNRSKITFSGYMSQDKMRLTTDTLFQWNNLAASLRWDRTVRDNLYYSITLGVGGYHYLIQEPQEFQAFDLTYRITYPTLKADFNYTKKRPVSFGVHATAYNLNPGTLQPTSTESSIRSIDIANENALEVSLYYSENFTLSDRIYIDAGMRYVLFARLGPATVYQYKPDEPLEPRNIIDSTLYQAGEIVKLYHGLEPRVAIRYAIDQNSSVKLGYHRIHQFLHLISNTAAITPVDVWQLSNPFFRPQRADQIAAGYFRNLKNNTLELSGELFYKHIDNVLEFKDGAQLILNDKLETALLPGILKAYGIELSAAKFIGKFQGSLNYTWSRSLRQVNGAFDSEQINNGMWYPSNFDQPHVVNATWRIGLTRRHFFSGSFAYHTGRPISLPAQVFHVDGIAISNFQERNTYRLPDYHRLDLAFIIEGNHKRKKLWGGTWIASVYNAYGRRNAYSVFFQQNEQGILKPYQLSVIGAIIPSITYNFKF
ncbi:MAG: carboxypeptidase-like regulatory domain-containing protein [Cyclobacteriaceae bacterium]|nr:carboxypeptidase-like regulatory domain-containing protein [Cyclobacteriaceae bacterium]